jgi:hypothetical protein
MTEKKLVAVDPGNMTGIAWATLADGKVRITDTAEWPSMTAITVIKLRGNYDHMFIENFIPRQGAHSWQPEALYVIGALTWMTKVEGLSGSLELQNVSDAKRFATNEKLARVGWDNKGNHYVDALRHMLLGCVRHGWIGGGELL